LTTGGTQAARDEPPEGTFLAAEWTGTAGGFRVRRFPIAPPGPGEAQVRVLACSVCLTEVHFTDGYYDELDAPARLGHEYCGVVTATGPGVSGLAEGDLVAGFDAFGGFGEMVTADAALFVPLYGFHFRNLSLIGSFGADRQAATEAAGLLGELDLDGLISHRFGLDDIGAAFDAARSGAGLKVVVYPGQEQGQG